MKHERFRIPGLLAVALCVALGPWARAGEVRVRDTLSIGEEKSPEAAKVLRAVAWEPAEFSASVTEATAGDRAWTDADALVRFASPLPDKTANGAVNTVVLEWYRARGGDEKSPAKAPAVLLLHTLDSRLFLSRGVARELAKNGIHAFVMQAPGYERRVYPEFRAYGDRFFDRAAQSIADARRSRDAVAALPGVEGTRISIQGISLGGFFATGAAALDGAFEHCFLLFSGADLHTLFTKGQREASWVRDSLRRQGVDDAALREKCEAMELSHVAHRLDPAKTWLFSAAQDQVVPRACTDALRKAAKIADDHHFALQGDHYMVLLNLPWCSAKMVEIVRNSGGRKGTAGGGKKCLQNG